MKKAIIVTTSWDDGDLSDLKVAELLCSRGIGGTFYVPIRPYQRRPTLDHADLRSLALEGFEIGAHGISHQLLPSLSGDALVHEVTASKQILENFVGERVRMFCYPRGRYNRECVRCLREAGYEGARINRMLATRLDFSPFEMPVTVQAFRHPRSVYIRNLGRAGDIRGLCGYVLRLSRLDRWVELGQGLFDTVLREGGVWHLYGHSWEIDELNLWGDLREMLDYVCKRDGVRYVPNGDVLDFRRRGD